MQILPDRFLNSPVLFDFLSPLVDILLSNIPIFLKMMVGGNCLQPRIHKGLAHGEMVQSLPGAILEADVLVEDIVVETSDAGSADTRSLRLEIQQLTNTAAFPVESPVIGGPERLQDRVKMRQHS